MGSLFLPGEERAFCLPPVSAASNKMSEPFGLATASSDHETASVR